MSEHDSGPDARNNQTANQNTLQAKYTAKPAGTNIGFTGMCPCGGRVTCYMKGSKPNRTSVSTCGACGRCEVVKE